MTVSDLGVTDVGTLPSSTWYFAKEWRRGFERLFTFNVVAKTELELRITNEKAAEALIVEGANPDDTEALLFALENYTKAQERLAQRLGNLKETSENPNVEKLLEKLDEQNAKHVLLLEQLAERWNTDPYVEDANIVNPQGARDNHLQGAVDIAQRQIQGTMTLSNTLHADIGGLSERMKIGEPRAGRDADTPRIEDAKSIQQPPQEVSPSPRVKPAVVTNPPAVSVPADKTQETLVTPTPQSALPPKPKAAPSPVELTMYTHPLYGFSFNYPKTWNKIENTPSDPNSLSFSRYPQNSESLEIHMTVGEKLNMEQVVSSDAVDYKKETIVVAGASVQMLTFEQFDRHGGSLGFMREIHIAIPLSSGKFLNLLGVCSTVGSSYDGRCTTAIDDIMKTIVIPSIKV